MENDTLFLLKPNFSDDGKGPYFCPGCAEIVGLLEFYPELRKRLDVEHLEFQRPRAVLVELLGTENQSCPVLILRGCPSNLPDDFIVRESSGRFFVEGAREISVYLAHVYGTGIPH